MIEKIKQWMFDRAMPIIYVLVGLILGACLLDIVHTLRNCDCPEPISTPKVP